MKRIFQVLAVGLSCGPALALWFPLRTEPFDPNHGMTSYPEAWAKEHRVGILHGMGGTPIAPHWMITAGHLSSIRIFDYKEGAHGNGSYQIVESITHPKFPLVDLRLCRVKEVFPDYARVAKEPSASNEVMTMYGRGKSAPTIPVKIEDRIIGWAQDKWRDGKDGLRSGLITNHTTSSFRDAHYFKWSLDWGPATSYSDSGHPVFRGSEVAGILSAAPATVTFRFGESGLCTNTAYIFDSEGISSCSKVPVDLKTFTAAVDLSRYSDWIHEVITPAVRVSAAADKVAEGWKPWPKNSYSFEKTDERIEMLSLTNAAPEEVYRGILYHRWGSMEFTQGELLQTERYTVRLHFGGVHFRRRGQVVQDISINGVKMAQGSDPFSEPGGRNKATIMEFKGIKPDQDNRMTIRFTPSGFSRAVALSGLEILLER